MTAPPLRAVAMEPARFEGQNITIVGQFRGRNLFGDLPEAPAQNRYQFVLRSSDAALWVMGVQPQRQGIQFRSGQAHRLGAMGEGAGHGQGSERV